MHALITAPPGTGKSTLIRRVLAELNRPVFGFETEKDTSQRTEAGFPVFLREPGSRESVLLGCCDRRLLSVNTEAFDAFAPRLRRPIPAGSIVMMDEIGTMESSSIPFREAVLALLDGDTPVIAAVKAKDTPFLTAVRSHPNCRIFHLTEDNREALFHEVLAFLQAQFSPK